MTNLLLISYLMLAMGMSAVFVDIRLQGLRTVAALRRHMWTFRPLTVAGASSALLGVIGAVIVVTSVAGGETLHAVMAVPAVVAFAWGVWMIRVA